MKKKVVALVLALTLLVVCAVAGTVAWLTAQSDTVTNTFTTSNIKVKLEETEGANISGGKQFKMVPGHTIAKDPKATVETGSEPCYLFVKLTKSENFDTYLSYVMANGWTRLTTDASGATISELIYYRKVTTDGASDTSMIGVAYSVLKDNQVTVKSTVTESQMENLDVQAATKPTLTITAYASQLYKDNNNEFSPAEAWANVPADSSSSGT